MLEDDRFLASHAEFEAWAEGRKQLRMEWFYREMRRKTGLLMEGTSPRAASGTSTTTTASRADDLFRAPPLAFAPDATVEEVLDLVEARFPATSARCAPSASPPTPRRGGARARPFPRPSPRRFGDLSGRDAAAATAT
jgi:deoxyribodipyrimidine photolyase-related protein